MIHVALIGYGMSAKTFHIPFLAANPNYRITAIVSRQSALDLSAMPHARHYPDTESMLQDAPVDLVVNTTPNTLHYPLTAACLRAGKHVVLEKPMTPSLEEAQELVALAAARRLLLAVFHNRRLDGDFLTVQSLIRDQHCGAIRLFRTHWDRFRPEVRDRWRENPGAGSGIWYDLGPHLVDQALCLFGLPQAVSAHIRALRPQSPSDDYAHVQLHYPECEVILHTAPYSSAPTPRFCVEGERGSYVKFGLDPQEAQLKSGMHPDDPAFGLEDPAQYGILWPAQGKAQTIPTQRGRFADYYANLAAAIYGRAGLAVSTEEALNVMRILLLARDSARLGHRLAVDDSLYFQKQPPAS